MTDFYCTDYHTVTPKNDKMSVDHPCDSQVILITLQVYAALHILIRDIILTSLSKASFTCTRVYGSVGYSLRRVWIYSH